MERDKTEELYELTQQRAESALDFPLSSVRGLGPRTPGIQALGLPGVVFFACQQAALATLEAILFWAEEQSALFRAARVVPYVLVSEQDRPKPRAATHDDLTKEILGERGLKAPYLTTVMIPEVNANANTAEDLDRLAGQWRQVLPAILGLRPAPDPYASEKRLHGVLSAFAKDPAPKFRPDAALSVRPFSPHALELAVHIAVPEHAGLAASVRDRFGDVDADRLRDAAWIARRRLAKLVVGALDEQEEPLMAPCSPELAVGSQVKLRAGVQQLTFNYTGEDVAKKEARAYLDKLEEDGQLDLSPELREHLIDRMRGC